MLLGWSVWAGGLWDEGMSEVPGVQQCGLEPWGTRMWGAALWVWRDGGGQSPGGLGQCGLKEEVHWMGTGGRRGWIEMLQWVVTGM